RTAGPDSASRSARARSTMRSRPAPGVRRVPDQPQSERPRPPAPARRRPSRLPTAPRTSSAGISSRNPVGGPYWAEPDWGRCPAPVGAAEAAGAGPAATVAAGLGGAHELGGDLGEEPARRVVLGGAEQGPLPGVGEVEALAGPGDAHVAEAPLLLELGRLAQR